jgi:hypothetical protein
MQLYVDMDGVLADFDAHHEKVFGERPCKIKDNVDWKAICAIPDYYLSIPPMKDAITLWSYIERYYPIVLTGIPSSIEEAADNKRNWVKKYIGSYVRVECCRSSEKCNYAKPGDILIDDGDKYRQLWIDKGGIWITHTSAEDTINALRQLGL